MCYLDAMEHKKYKIAHWSERKSKCQFQRGVFPDLRTDDVTAGRRENHEQDSVIQASEWDESSQLNARY